MPPAQHSVTERLDLFVVRAQELEQTRLIQSSPSTKWSMDLSQGGVATVEWDEPDEEDLRSFLLTLRQFVSNNEPIFLNGIHNILYRSLTDEELKRQLRYARARLSWAEQGWGIQVKVDKTAITPER